jgi:uncharacterized protein
LVWRIFSSVGRAELYLPCSTAVLTKSFYTREIAREVDASVGAVQRELENLSKVGLILRKSMGNQVFYQANRDAPIFPEMRALLNKTIGIFGVLRSAIHPLSKRIVAAFVYGSVAREEETAQSDVDLMVIGKATLEEVLSRLSTAEKGIGRSINPTVYSLAEFKSKLAAGNQKSTLYRLILGSSLLSMRPSVRQQLRCERQVIARSLSPAIT